MNTHVYYHGDLDGYISADIVKKHSKNLIFHECQYPNVTFDFIKKDLCDDDVIYILDFCFDDNTMMILYNLWGEQTIWIDHHKSSIQRSKKEGFDNLLGLRQIGLSGCELTSLWFVERQSQFVKLIGQFDTFRTSNDKSHFHGIVLPFFYGCEFYKEQLNPENYDCKKDLIFDKEYLNKIKKIGKIIYKQKYQQYYEQCKKNSYVRQIWGHRVLCLNCIDKGSMIFQIPKYFNEQKHDMMLVYNYDGQKWNYGFYAPLSKTQVDCSQIAKKYNGGGHKGASGASTDKLIQELL